MTLDHLIFVFTRPTIDALHKAFRQLYALGAIDDGNGYDAIYFYKEYYK